MKRDRRPRPTKVHIDEGNPSTSLEPPAFARHGKGKKSRPRVPRRTRVLVYERDGRACRRCGTTTDLTIDHIIPTSKGGRNVAANMQTLCQPCNAIKADTVEPARRRR